MIIDLCSGRGTATRAFRNVIRIDSNLGVRPTIVADVRYLPLRPGLKPKLIWASPPCKYFSKARWFNYGHDPVGIADSLDVISGCFRAFEYLNAQDWVLENPTGTLRKLIGKPTTQITYPMKDGPIKGKIYDKKTDLWSNSRSLRRAMIPFKVSKALHKIAKSDRSKRRLQ